MASPDDIADPPDDGHPYGVDPHDFLFDRVDRDDRDGVVFERTLHERWCFNGRSFGGYTSALALAAMFETTKREAAASLSVSFLEAAVPGPLLISVERLRQGRRAEAVRATITQPAVATAVEGTRVVDPVPVPDTDTDGGAGPPLAARPVLVATAWLADGWREPPTTPVADLFGRYGASDDEQAPSATAPGTGPGARRAITSPADCPSLDWLTREWKVLRYASRRGMDYPTTWDEFTRGRPEVALWLRIDARDPRTVEPLPHPQLGDVLHADAHLFDAPGQITGFEQAWLLSLDLSVSWQPGAHLVPSTAWRLYEGRGSVAPGGVTAFGSLRDEDGALLAVTTSQGLLR